MEAGIYFFWSSYLQMQTLNHFVMLSLPKDMFYLWIQQDHSVLCTANTRRQRWLKTSQPWRHNSLCGRGTTQPPWKQENSIPWQWQEALSKGWQTAVPKDWWDSWCKRQRLGAEAGCGWGSLLHIRPPLSFLSCALSAGRGQRQR